MKKIFIFFVISCLVSWTVVLLLFQLGGIGTAWAALLLPLYMTGPAIAALIMARWTDKGQVIAALGLKMPQWSFMGIAWLVGLFMVGGAAILSVQFGPAAWQAPAEGAKAATEAMGQDVGAAMDAPGMNGILILSALILGPLINIPLMLSEELGWRGWLYTELSRHPRFSGFWTLSAITGLMWGLWHVPIIAMGHNYPGLPVLGAIMFTGFCILQSPIYTWLREKGRSVWTACVLHGTTNAAAGTALFMQTDMSMPWRGVVGIGGFIMMVLVLIMIALTYERAKVRKVA